MGPNVKDPQALRSAQAIARVARESMTRVVLQALRERHAETERCKGLASVADLLAIAGRAAALVKRFHADLLYDAQGLPQRRRHPRPAVDGRPEPARARGDATG